MVRIVPPKSHNQNGPMIEQPPHSSRLQTVSQPVAADIHLMPGNLIHAESMATKSEIFAAFTAEDSVPLGDIWCLTAKKRDFYLDASWSGRLFHLSVHGPQGRHTSHRFHMKIDRQDAKERTKQGHFVAAGEFPDGGLEFSGEKLGDKAWRVARIRWLGEMQQKRFRAAARTKAEIPELSGARTGVKMSGLLPANFAADLDIFVSFDKPFWPDDESSAFRTGPAPSVVDNARLGPIGNGAGMWLSAVSYRRSLTTSPCPGKSVPRRPKPGEVKTWIMSASPEKTSHREIYWFIHSMTSNEVLAAWPTHGAIPSSLLR